jgi:phage shock protein PspC (stress-responsive transcriptional regulator)
MKKNTWKQKLTSRKLWFAIAGVVIGIAMAFGVDGNELEEIIGMVTGALTALGSIASYISGESAVDAANAQNSTPINISVTDDDSGETAE